MLLAAVFVIGAYLLGSVSFALIVGKGIYGVDVRKSGSGNIGTTNVFRVLGKKAGIVVFIGDMAKGFVPVFLAARLVPEENAALVSVLAAGAAILGHTFPVFLKFKGGKGVATGGGTIIALMPLLFLLAFSVFWLALLVSRMVSIASMSAVFCLSAAVIITGQPLPYIIFALLGSAVIIYAHRTNIRRIASGTENQVTFPWQQRHLVDKSGKK